MTVHISSANNDDDVCNDNTELKEYIQWVQQILSKETTEFS